jgi:hypothetical protein
VNDEMTRKLIQLRQQNPWVNELVDELTCGVRNSEDKLQEHSWSDVYRLWGRSYRRCIRCKLQVRVLRGRPG